MKKNWIHKFVFFVFITSILGQGKLKLKNEENQEVITGIYQEIVLEDFTTLPFRDSNPLKKNFFFNVGLSKFYPAPFYGAGSYAKIELQSSGSEALQLIFEKEIEIKKQIKSLSLWVYSTMLPGDLWLLLKDTTGEVHYISFGKLNFRGWRKLTAKIPPSVVQEDLTPTEILPIRILEIIYRPGPEKRRKLDQILFIDHLTAKAREKYLLP